ELDQVHRTVAEDLQLVDAGRVLSTFFICGEPEISARRFGRRLVHAFNIDNESFSESAGATVDVYLRRSHDLWKATRRIRTPIHFRSSRSDGWEWYQTKHGYLSVRPRR